MGEATKKIDLSHYTYVLVWLIIVTIVLVANPENRKVRLGEIRWRGLFAYLIVAAVIYGVLMSRKISDDAWLVAHFVSFFVAVYFIPNNWIIILAASMSWEIYEDYRGRTDPEYREKKRKISLDIVAHCLGYYMGSMFFSKAFLKRN